MYLLTRQIANSTQEESNTISQNTRMGISYRFQEGKVIVNHNKFLGYTKDETGNLVIVPEEAEIVRRIFREFLEGKSPYKIAAGLERDKKLTGSGGSRWYDSTVTKILKNEKYMGDALLQKTYTVDFLTKKRVKNSGYSKTGKSAYTSEYAFSGKLFCQNCGSKYRRSAWGSGKNKKHVWICINHQMNGDPASKQKAVKEKDIEQAFLRAMN